MKSQLLRLENLSGDQIQYLTGLSPEVWQAVWQYFDPSLSADAACTESAGRRISLGSSRKAVLGLEDQLLLVLVHLRRLGRMEQELSYQFGVSKSRDKFSLSVSWIRTHLAQLVKCT